MKTNYIGLPSYKIIEECGGDASKWAAAFHQHAILIYSVHLDEGWLTGWFANAIETAKDKK